MVVFIPELGQMPPPYSKGGYTRVPQGDPYALQPGFQPYPPSSGYAPAPPTLQQQTSNTVSNLKLGHDTCVSVYCKFGSSSVSSLLS